MIVSGLHSSKIDSALKAALESASGDEPLRAVMILGDEGPELFDIQAPKEAQTREAIRIQMINSRKIQICERLSEIKKELEHLTLSIRGGILGTTVVAEGTAQAILSSLDLTGVKHASLDGPFTTKKGMRM